MGVAASTSADVSLSIEGAVVLCDTGDCRSRSHAIIPQSLGENKGFVFSCPHNDSVDGIYESHSVVTKR